MFVEVIEHEPDNKLVDEFMNATEGFGSNYDFATSRRQIEASLSQKEKQQQQGTVIGVGPDCRELEEGDIVIFPLYSGSMVTIVDEITNTYKRVFVLTETSCLARYREG